MSGNTANHTNEKVMLCFFFSYARHLRAMRNKRKRARFQNRLDAAKVRVAKDAAAYQETHHD